MKRIIISLLLAFLSANVFGQNVIKFLGIPIEGNKKEMISKLKAKGYEYNPNTDLLTGEFNGTNVLLSVQTVNNRVWRIAIVDAKSTDETNIKIRFNNLFDQFSNNIKYRLANGQRLKESDDVSYDMLVHNKRYEAGFSLKDDSIHGFVWYMIISQYGEYSIAMFYENLDNAANGDDL